MKRRCRFSVVRTTLEARVEATVSWQHGQRGEDEHLMDRHPRVIWMLCVQSHCTSQICMSNAPRATNVRGRWWNGTRPSWEILRDSEKVVVCLFSRVTKNNFCKFALKSSAASGRSGHRSGVHRSRAWIRWRTLGSKKIPDVNRTTWCRGYCFRFLVRCLNWEKSLWKRPPQGQKRSWCVQTAQTQQLFRSFTFATVHCCFLEGFLNFRFNLFKQQILLSVWVQEQQSTTTWTTASYQQVYFFREGGEPVSAGLKDTPWNFHTCPY